MHEPLDSDAATAADTLEPTSPTSMASFLIAYLFWVVVLGATILAVWARSSGLSVFRYAGF